MEPSPLVVSCAMWNPIPSRASLAMSAWELPCRLTMSARMSKRQGAPKGKDVWLIDSGSEQDLISKAALRSASKAVRKQASQPIRLVTANGNIAASEIADINVDALREPAQPYILESSPAVLSLGVKCLGQGYSFHWESAKAPTMVRPAGALIQLKVDGHVPHMDSSCEAEPPLSAAAASKPAPEPVHVTKASTKVMTPTKKLSGLRDPVKSKTGCRSKYQRTLVRRTPFAAHANVPRCLPHMQDPKVGREGSKPRDLEITSLLIT